MDGEKAGAGINYFEIRKRGKGVPFFINTLTISPILLISLVIKTLPLRSRVTFLVLPDLARNPDMTRSFLLA
jgi:hypothetical protein